MRDVVNVNVVSVDTPFRLERVVFQLLSGLSVASNVPVQTAADLALAKPRFRDLVTRCQ